MVSTFRLLTKLQVFKILLKFSSFLLVEELLWTRRSNACDRVKLFLVTSI
jgi:hypothetical protein